MKQAAKIGGADTSLFADSRNAELVIGKMILDAGHCPEEIFRQLVHRILLAKQTQNMIELGNTVGGVTRRFVFPKGVQGQKCLVYLLGIGWRKNLRRSVVALGEKMDGDHFRVRIPCLIGKLLGQIQNISAVHKISFTVDGDCGISPDPKGNGGIFSRFYKKISCAPPHMLHTDDIHNGILTIINHFIHLYASIAQYSRYFNVEKSTLFGDLSVTFLFFQRYTKEKQK